MFVTTNWGAQTCAIPGMRAETFGGTDAFVIFARQTIRGVTGSFFGVVHVH